MHVHTCHDDRRCWRRRKRRSRRCQEQRDTTSRWTATEGFRRTDHERHHQTGRTSCSPIQLSVATNAEHLTDSTRQRLWINQPHYCCRLSAAGCRKALESQSYSIQWRIQGQDDWCDCCSALLVWPWFFKDNFALFCKLHFATEPYNPYPKASSDCPCFLPVKAASKCSQTYHFGYEQWFFFWGRGNSIGGQGGTGPSSKIYVFPVPTPKNKIKAFTCQNFQKACSALCIRDFVLMRYINLRLLTYLLTYIVVILMLSRFVTF